MNHEHDKTIADCTEAIRLNSRDSSAYARRGTAFRMKGDYDRTIADCTEAIRLDPTYSWAFNIRGACYRGKGNLVRAADDFTEVIRLNPCDSWALAYRGDTRRRIGDIENGNATLRNFGKGESASAFLKTGDYDQAIADLIEGIRLTPDHPQASMWLAVAYVARGRTHRERCEYDRAISDCSEAIRLDPKNAKAFAVRGDARWCNNEYDLATSDLTEAIRLDPQKDFKDLLDKVRRSIRNAAAKDTPASKPETKPAPTPVAVTPHQKPSKPHSVQPPQQAQQDTGVKKDQAMNVTCPHCQKAVSVELKTPGQSFVCCSCQGTFTVGAPKAQQAAHPGRSSRRLHVAQVVRFLIVAHGCHAFLFCKTSVEPAPCSRRLHECRPAPYRSPGRHKMPPSL